jgi:AmmeMemoRadiSam system protein B
MVRRPVVAGTFYPGSKSRLEDQLSSFITSVKEKQKVIGLVSPHAGYIYSGGCAGKGFSKIKIPNTVVILGVNHNGMGQSFAVDENDFWNTPLGDIPVERELAEVLVSDSDLFEYDSQAGAAEHSLEVQVPFIQYLNQEAKILPITLSSINLNQLVEAGEELAQVTSERNDILIVASTDMSHYIDAQSAKIKDLKALQKILELDPEGLFDLVRNERISMCGVSPTTMMLSAAKALGARHSEIIQYTNSGEVSGDFDQVVGYASMIVY